MASLQDSSQAITTLLGARSRILDHFLLASKFAAAIGACILGIAKFASWNADISYVAAIIVFLATAFILWGDRSASTTLSEARNAMDKALEQEKELETGRRKSEAAERAYAAELERLSHFQAARDLARAIFEDVLLSTERKDEISVINLMLQQSRRQLFLAHGFGMNDFYTLCVYQRVIATDGKAELVCKAHIRAIDCDLSKARVWKEGIGAAGCSLARREEIIVPNLRAAMLGSLYSLPEKKSGDDSHYGSIVAEPITCDANGEPWGVLVATSSVVGHFSLEDRSYADVTQSLAGMISLGVKLVRSKNGEIKPGSHP